MENRILNAQKRLRALEAEVFTEKDLRGLSKIEKEFVRENGYKKIYDVQSAYRFETGRFFLFINRNRLGKMQLYALRKDMLLRTCRANKNYPTCWNCEVWLEFHWSWPHFNTFDVEIHKTDTPNIQFLGL